MKLLFKGTIHLTEYHNHETGIDAVAGQEIETTEKIAAELLADFPGIFVEPGQAKKDVDKAPVDKQIKSAKRK